jgi:hypothetical protein
MKRPVCVCVCVCVCVYIYIYIYICVETDLQSEVASKMRFVVMRCIFS